MQYNKLFDPDGLEDLRTVEEMSESGSGDRRDGKIYVYDEKGDIVLAVNIALATGRPLLISGPSGSGKSSLAMHVARVLGRRYYEFVVTARAQAQDLTWRFDAVRRLADAQVQGVRRPAGAMAADAQDAAPVAAEPGVTEHDDVYPYIEPQALWWVYDSESARRRGRPPHEAMDPSTEAEDLAEWDPCQEWEKDTQALPPEVAAKLPQTPQLDSCVLLVDEIDKADPDVPNNLLVELGSRQFLVDLIDRTIKFAGQKNDWRARPLVMITTNKERPLPQPFIRRCVVLEIPKPTRKLMRDIARRNLPGRSVEFFDQVLNAVLGRQVEAGQAVDENEVVDVSIAEYVDTLRACAGLDSSADTVSGDLLQQVIQRTVWSIKEKTLRPQ